MGAPVNARLRLRKSASTRLSRQWAVRQRSLRWLILLAVRLAATPLAKFKVAVT